MEFARAERERGKSLRDAAEAVAKQRERRGRLFELVDEMGLALGAMGTHPWAGYLDQRIIDTPHYRRLSHDLGWVAQRNNTWSTHVHMGVRGADRAIAVCDWMRELLPLLLAVSANSPFLDGRDTGLDTVRTEIFTRTFPRCGVPSPFVDWRRYAEFVGLLEGTNTIVESTQLWWSVRPHHHFGTVEVRICDAQTRGDESFALAGLIAACIAQTALDYDERGYEGAGRPLVDREIEENLWRAIRHGMSGGRSISARASRSRRGRRWRGCSPGPSRPAPTSASRSTFRTETAPSERVEALDSGVAIEDIYRDAVAETKRTYRPPTRIGIARPAARSYIDSRAAKPAGGTNLTSFLTDYGVVVALVCAGAAVVYGLMITQRLLKKSPGNERMQEISGAVQEGASAYLRRQYTIIAAVAVPLAIVLWILQDYKTAIGFVIGGMLSGSAGFIGMNLSVRANARVAEAARGGVPPALDVAFKGGSVTGLLVVGLALLGVAGYYGVLDPHRQHRQGGRRRADRPRLRRLADLRLRPSRRRHLHQGRRRRRRPGRQGRGGHPRGRPAQPGRDRRQRRRQRRRLRRHGRGPLRDLRGHLGRGDAARRPHLHRRGRRLRP